MSPSADYWLPITAPRLCKRLIWLDQFHLPARCHVTLLQSGVNFGRTSSTRRHLVRKAGNSTPSADANRQDRILVFDKADWPPLGQGCGSQPDSGVAT